MAAGHAIVAGLPPIIPAEGSGNAIDVASNKAATGITVEILERGYPGAS